MSKKVFVGLSGGVDSAVSAALLKQQEFDVVGVFIKIWQPEFIECTWARDRLDAMRVTVALNIPFREIDLSADYKRMVVEDMLAGYARGVTPNPDVLCNRHIKFGSFMQYARDNGADYIATGHYARIEKSASTFSLLRGIDGSKDQSYFLYTVGQPDLARTMFPVGGMLKTEVRHLAHQWQLPVAQKSDSQGLCFVGDVTMKDFLSRYLKFKHGSVLNMNGAVIGVHEGAALYTIGQRHGFIIETNAGDRVPHYVVSIDVSTNTIHVSPHREDAARKEIEIHSIHWIGEIPAMPLRAQTQARYREKPRNATITLAGGRAKVIFDEPQIAAPGQSLVVYSGNVCLGGGIVTE